MKSNLRNNLISIQNDVSNLFKQVGNTNDKLMNRSMDNSFQLNGYTDRLNVYDNNLENNSLTSPKIARDNNLIKLQNAGTANESDNRKNLYPQSGIKNYGNLRDAYIENKQDGTPFINASIRDNTPPYDVLMSPEINVINRKNKGERGEQRGEQRSEQRGEQRGENFKESNETKETKETNEKRDNRFNLYPNSSVVDYGQEKNIQVANPGNRPSIAFENVSQRNPNVRNFTGDVFTHNSNRDRVPINPKINYRSSTYESSSNNQLDEDVTHEKQKNRINTSQVNYPTGDVFTHNTFRDRVPIDPKDLYRSSDYVSNQYNQLDIDVENVPDKARVQATTNMILNREFEIVSDNLTSKDEFNETTMIHTPYTQLDKFDKSNVVFKNINEEKIQVDVLNEYIVNIDSSDRNYTYYPNQFKMRVLFNASSDTSADLKISRSFENIKYLRLETATFPRYYTLKLSDVSTTSTLADASEKTIIDAIRLRIHTTKDATSEAFMAYLVGYFPPTGYQVQYVAYKYTSNTNINAKISIINSDNVPIAYELNYVGANDTTFKTSRYIVDKTKDLSKDRYLMINLDEITDNTQNSTSGKNQYNYLYPDYITDNYFYGDNHFVDKIFKNAKLGIIQNLTITLSDSFGSLIQGGKYIDTVDSTTDAISTTDTITSTTVYNDSLTYIRHPYYRNFQLSLMFKVGCYETEIDKKLFF